MAKPTILTRLVKGKLIDAFPGFVETFNYIVDFIENLKGEGDMEPDDDNGNRKVWLDRSTADYPVIRGGGKGDELEFLSGDDSNVLFTEEVLENKTIVKIDVYYV